MPRNAVSHSRRIAVVGLAPAVRHVGHHEDAEPVGPVELARHLDLHVRADGVEAEPPRDQDLLADRLVARPVPVAVGVPRLVERHLEVDGPSVQRDVRVAEAGKRPGADRSAGRSSSCTRSSAAPTASVRASVVEVRVLERPRARPSRRAAGSAAPRARPRRAPALPSATDGFVPIAGRHAQRGPRRRPARGRTAARGPRCASAPGSGGPRTSRRRPPGAPRGTRSARAPAPCRSPACPRA